MLGLKLHFSFGKQFGYIVTLYKRLFAIPSPGMLDPLKKIYH